MIELSPAGAQRDTREHAVPCRFCKGKTYAADRCCGFCRDEAWAAVDDAATERPVA